MGQPYWNLHLSLLSLAPKKPVGISCTHHEDGEGFIFLLAQAQQKLFLFQQLWVSQQELVNVPRDVLWDLTLS